MLRVLLADLRVQEIQEQPAPVFYLDEDGQKHRHTFDARITTQNETRIAIALRPIDRAGSLRALLKWMRPQIPKSFADYAVVKTEVDLPPTLTTNAATLLRYRRTRCANAISTILDIMKKVPGPIEIGRIVATTGLNNVAFGAIVNLIDDTVLTLSDDRIAYHSLVKLDRTVNFAE